VIEQHRVVARERRRKRNVAAGAINECNVDRYAVVAHGNLLHTQRDLQLRAGCFKTVIVGAGGERNGYGRRARLIKREAHGRKRRYLEIKGRAVGTRKRERTHIATATDPTIGRCDTVFQRRAAGRRRIRARTHEPRLCQIYSAHRLQIFASVVVKRHMHNNAIGSAFCGAQVQIDALDLFRSHDLIKREPALLCGTLDGGGRSRLGGRRRRGGAAHHGAQEQRKQTTCPAWSTSIVCLHNHQTSHMVPQHERRQVLRQIRCMPDQNRITA